MFLLLSITDYTGHKCHIISRYKSLFAQTIPEEQIRFILNEILVNDFVF